MKKMAMLLVLVICASGIEKSANASSDLSEAQWIVAITNNGGFHYSMGCGFYELRTLLSNGLSTGTDAKNSVDEPIVEFRVISKQEISTVTIGDHWISSGRSVVSLDSKMFDRIIGLVEQRPGRGMLRHKIDEKIMSIYERISDPTYKEERRC